MADLLIHHLEKKGQEHSSLAMLVNQWGFDQHLIPKALQNVGSLFPHYSRHDESHSKQILVNIERLLADNLSLLTATDTWLLLEAAYWHDIGMVVPQKALEDALAEQDFKDYLAELSRNEHHELHRLASRFDASNPCQCFAGAHSPVDAVDKFRQLMAEWFRRQHARRASEVVQSPWQTIGLNSPRTELIPSRLFRLLGQICLMHGSDFNTMMEHLPFREAGMAQEDCHPRFVACLLRLGDLLDLDDNRFCPVMQHIAGDNRPALSKAHEAKHQSIRHLRMDRDRIEVSAECEDIDSYLETWKWFDWLKQEMQQQMSRWSDIVPRRELGLLPTLGDLKVTSKNQKILRPGQRPQFRIEGKNAIELLQGSNLYSNQFAFIQELVQNAIDATLIRIWLTDGMKNPEAWQNPLDEIPQQVLHNPENAVRIEITITDEKRDDNMLNYSVVISDTGTGISEEDLAYILEVGGSQKNKSRQRIIQRMPEWMRPAGIFGIGLQSAFLKTNVINIDSQNIFDGKSIVIEMHNPLGKEQGLVKVTDGRRCFERRSHTSISIKFPLPKAIAVTWRDDEVVIKEIQSTIDPVMGLSLESIDLIFNVSKFCSNTSPLIEVSANLFGHVFKTSNNYTVEHGVVQNFTPIPVPMIIKRSEVGYPSEEWRPPEWLYRGRRFRCFPSLKLPFYRFQINILAADAGKWLELDKQRGKESALIESQTAIFEAINKNLAKNQLEQEEPTNLALLKAIVSKRLKPESNLSLSSRWAEKQFKPSSHCCITSDVLSIKQLLDREELYFYVAGATTFIYCCKRSFLKTHACLEISSDLWVNFLLKELVSAGKSYFIYDVCKVSGLHENVGEIYCITDDKEKCYTEKALAEKLIYQTKNTAGRLLLTVGSEYKKLWLTHRYAPFGLTKIFFMQPNNGNLILLSGYA